MAAEAANAASAPKPEEQASPMHNESTSTTEVPPLADRPESVGFWAKGWPVLALAFMTLLFIRACVPSGPPPAASFDPGVATQSANAQAMAALAAITPSTPLETALKALNMPVINFASGSVEIPADAQPVLVRAADVIKGLPSTLRLEIGGHTDNTGSAEANMLLARKRAQAVADFLVKSGVPRERIYPQGYGDARPVAVNTTEEGRFHNRRIEIKPQSR
jgi:outer membrane protein OmpA-like peptidoglycan-associated protein